MSGRTSVIIPAYNAELFLAEALESVKRQTISVKEIVVTDDGSTVPVAIPDGWDGPPIRIIRTLNRGLAAARNTALGAASGEFVAFLDADDLWEPQKIEAQEVTLDANPAAVACFTQCARAPGFFGFGPYPPTTVSDDELLVVLWYESIFPPSAVMARRTAVEKVGRFREDFLNGEDFELWMRLMALGRLLQVPRALTRYRIHPGQFTNNVWKRLYGGKQARAVAANLHAKRLAAAGLSKQRLTEAYRRDMMLVFYRRQFSAARRLLWDYWSEHPTDLRVLVYWIVSLFPPSLITRFRGKLTAPELSSAGYSGDDHTAWEKLVNGLPINHSEKPVSNQGLAMSWPSSE